MLHFITNALLILLIVLSAILSVPNITLCIKGNSRSLSYSVVKNGFAILAFMLVILIAILEYAFITTDLSFKLVYLNSHATKPLIFKIAGIWANHEGSMLLWLLVLCIAGLMYIPFSKASKKFKALVLSIQSLSIMLFGCYVYFVSNPFIKNILVPEQGLGLNPILQDIGLVYHPPSLYFGYVGFSITYAIVLALLLLGQLKFVMRDIKIWSLFSWSILTFGILMGSLWSYRELGWGGYWFWDPVENASLIPWLFANALIHNLFLFERRKIMFGWMVLSAVLTYASSILGTFIVRSGIINSVHTFANAPKRGILLFGIAIFILIFSSFIYRYRIAKFSLRHYRKVPLSKEFFLILNNIIMLTVAYIILFATLYPIIAELIFGIKLSIGARYYNTVMAPIAFAIIILSFLSTNVCWGKDTWHAIRCRLHHELIALFFSLYLYLVMPIFLAISSSALIVFIINLYKKFRNRKVAYNSMLSEIAHFGFAVLVFAVVANSIFEKEVNYKLAIGEAIEFDGKFAKLEDIRFFQKDNFLVRQAAVSFGKHVAYPENRIYIAEETAAQESYQIKYFFHDYYFSINSTSDMKQDEIVVNITFKAFINLIWVAGYIIVLTLLSKFLLYLLRARKFENLK